MDEETNKLVWNAQVKELLIDGYDAIDAFEALRRSLNDANRPCVVATIVGGEQPDLPSHISLERRHVEFLVAAYSKYELSENAEGIGRALGLEPKGRGKLTPLNQKRFAQRNMTIAFEISKLREAGIAITRAIGEVADKLNMTKDAVRKSLREVDQAEIDKHLSKESSV